MKRLNFKPFLMTLLAVGFASCTDLEIEETDSRFGEQTGEFSGVDAEGVLNEIINNDLRGQVETQENLYALNEVSTDEFLVPTRGTDWGDNGVWRTLHNHTWSSNHTQILNTWNGLNRIVFNTTAILDERSSPDAVQEGEARFLRAWAMFWVNDFWGQQPFREVDDPLDQFPRVLTRVEAVDLMISDLETAVANLPATPSGGAIRPTRGAAQFLLAKILLNRHVYNGSGTPDPADMQRVVDLVDDMENTFSLHTGDYFEMFTDAVDTETIWYSTASVGNVMWNGLHYNQITPTNGGGGWNGFSTLAEFYDLFEGDPLNNEPGSGQEERRGFVSNDGSHLGLGYGFLIGQQYDANGDPLQDRPGNPLTFKKELPGLLGNDETTGIRVLKYHPENGDFAGHKILFRFADAHLMRAEAKWQLGEDITAEVNALRTLRGASALGSVGAQELLDERGRELYAEGWRRNDLIRFGQFTRPWSYKEVSGDDTKNLYPIPANALTSNPNLIQNEGY